MAHTGGAAAGVHVYYQHVNQSDPTSPLEDPTPHVVTFMLFRQEHWYFFGSTGWFDDSWQWCAARLGSADVLCCCCPRVWPSAFSLLLRTKGLDWLSDPLLLLA